MSRWPPREPTGSVLLRSIPPAVAEWVAEVQLSRLPPAPLAVALAIADEHADEIPVRRWTADTAAQSGPWVSAALLGECTELSEPRVVRAVEHLHRTGWVAVSADGDGWRVALTFPSVVAHLHL